MYWNFIVGLFSWLQWDFLNGTCLASENHKHWCDLWIKLLFYFIILNSLCYSCFENFPTSWKIFMISVCPSVYLFVFSFSKVTCHCVIFLRNWHMFFWFTTRWAPILKSAECTSSWRNLSKFSTEARQPMREQKSFCMIM